MKHKRIRPRLWTKDFSCITVATVLSAIGGEAMNLPISLLVFDQTQSTLLSALILVCGMLPDMILPILVAPLIDKGGKKKWIVGLDILLNVMNVLSKEYGEKYHPSLLLRKMVTAGFLGRKSGAGFYIYEDGKKVGVNPVLQQEHHLG